MYDFIIIICIISGFHFSFCFRFKTLTNPHPIISRFPQRRFILNLESDLDVKYNSKDNKNDNLDQEGWLMDLNEENVEGVFDLIRPQLSSDGGGINLCKIVDNEVYVTFTGSCVGCPYRSTTLKDVIENNLSKFLKSPNGIPISVKVIQD